MFLSETVATQVGAMALVPQLADAVRVPVIAAGVIADGRGIAAAFALGASGVQIIIWEDFGAKNVFTGRAARAMVNRIAGELGPMGRL